jgi:hypothetical protein
LLLKDPDSMFDRRVEGRILGRCQQAQRHEDRPDFDDSRAPLAAPDRTHS